LLVDFLHVTLAGAGQRKIRIQAAAAKSVGVVIGDAGNPEAELSVDAQFAQRHLPAGIGQQGLRRLPAGNMRNSALLAYAADIGNRPRLDDAIGMLVTE